MPAKPGISTTWAALNALAAEWTRNVERKLHRQYWRVRNFLQIPSDEQVRRRLPPGVEFFPNLAYRAGDSKAWRLDLVVPRDRSGPPRPAIVFIHGGGWRTGDKRRGYFLHGAICYASKGYVTATVNYRLTDEAPFPACFHDIRCAIRWLRAHAAHYHLDPSRIGAYGNSAGAHLAALAALVPQEMTFDDDGPLQEYASDLQAVCVSALPADFTNWSVRGWAAFLKYSLLAGPEETFPERARLASPISYVRPDAPPFLVIHGAMDLTVPVAQADRFVEALRLAGARDVTYLRFSGQGHTVFNACADETYPAMEAFFRRTLQAQQPVAEKTGGWS